MRPSKITRIMLSVLTIFILLLSCEKFKGGGATENVKTYSSDEFFGMVNEKTDTELETLLGKPLKIDKAKNNMEFFSYNVKVKDRRGMIYYPKVQLSSAEGAKKVVAVIWLPYDQLKAKK